MTQKNRKGKYGIVRYGGGSGLIPARRFQELQKTFEQPVREMTASEVHGYYASAERMYHQEAKKDVMALIPVVLKNLPAIVGKYNTLEEARKRKGFDKVKGQIEDAMGRMLSFKEGINRLRTAASRGSIDAAVMRHFGRDPLLMDDEQAISMGANLSSEEITWISVLKGIPYTVFNDNIMNVSGIAEYYFDGLEWAYETISDPVYGMTRDSYEVAGVTGIRSDTGFTEFEPQFASLVLSYYHAVIGDAHVFNRVWEQIGFGAVSSGDGKILSAWARREGKTLTDEVAAGLRKKVNEWLASLRIFFVSQGTDMPPHDIVRLIGILAHVPPSFFEERILCFVPCGKGVMILNREMREIEYVPMDEYVGHLAEHEIKYSSYDVHRDNKIWHFLFQRIRDHIVWRNEQEQNLGWVDEKALDIYLKYGIKVDLGIRKSFDVADAAQIHLDQKDYQYTSKISFWDLHVLQFVLDRLPQGLTKAIKRVCRKDNEVDPEALMKGTSRWGYFDKREGALVISHPPITDMEDRDYLQFEHCLAHEVGHGVYVSNPAFDKLWRALSRAKKNFPKDKRAGEFISAYASTSVEEDFAETFATFLIMPKEFRKAASKSNVLWQKYEFMKVLIGRDFEAGSDSERKFTLRDICGPIDFDYELHRKIFIGNDPNADTAILKRGMFELAKVMRHQAIRGLSGPQIESIERKNQKPKDLSSALDYGPIIHRVLLTRLGKKAIRNVDLSEVEFNLFERKDMFLVAMYFQNALGIKPEAAADHVGAIMTAMESYTEAMRGINAQLGEDLDE